MNDMIPPTMNTNAQLKVIAVVMNVIAHRTRATIGITITAAKGAYDRDLFIHQL
jgi:hypothetical protein